ncbi:hypothetical protein BDV96DRAFT_608120 [Lophiotrema nucula]|uniref:Heterokaryon incompatibility domain-containing protein n=1 Tax=Lophiotrema nucula TaxID=690887 RepID=A0A6A5YGT1_9PLEO|nr:hypothetical protein BDV96DRAFT_608120 [Lophiotrema nucula]
MEHKLYEYEQFRGERTIRLLKALPPVHGEFACEIVQAEIDDPPPYVALSYVWGIPITNCIFYVSDKRGAIIESLQSALFDTLGFLSEYRIAGLGGDTVFSQDEILLWADAILY